MFATLLVVLSLIQVRANVLDSARRVYRQCAGRLAPLSARNAGQSVILRTGESIPVRSAADIVRLRLETLLVNDGLGVAEDLVRRARSTEHPIEASRLDRLRSLGLIEPDGRVATEAAAVLRACARVDGERVTIVSPLSPPELDDEQLRAYLVQVETRVVAPIVKLANARGLNVTAATKPPAIDGPRTPRDRTLLVDLGGANSPITLIGPFGRMDVIAGSGLGDVAAWARIKWAVRKSMRLIPVSLGSDERFVNVFAALRDLGVDRAQKFSFPDVGLDQRPSPREVLVRSWNTVKPDGREPLGQEP